MAMWQQWEGRVVDGRFPLRECLSGSTRNAVYLTEANGAKAAIKLVSLDAERAESQISRWKFASKLSHPHLVRILDAGRWHADAEHDVVFVVMDHADENLAEVLSSRTLTPIEASEMLGPTLDALDYLHGHSMVLGNLKPGNVLVINDELQLASDAIRPVGKTEEPVDNSAYAAPEAATGEISPSSDIWALGMTLVEALTNRLPAWDGA